MQNVGMTPLLTDIGPPCAPWFTMQLSCAQRRLMVHNIVLYSLGGAQHSFHKPSQTDRHWDWQHCTPSKKEHAKSSCAPPVWYKATLCTTKVYIGTELQLWTLICMFVAKHNNTILCPYAPHAYVRYEILEWEWISGLILNVQGKSCCKKGVPPPGKVSIVCSCALPNPGKNPDRQTLT